MNRKISILVLGLSLCCATLSAQENQKSELQKSAEVAQTIPAARYDYKRAYEDYTSKGRIVGVTTEVDKSRFMGKHSLREIRYKH